MMLRRPNLIIRPINYTFKTMGTYCIAGWSNSTNERQHGASMVFTIYTIYKYLSCSHLCRHLGKWHLQAIATTGARFPDLDIIEIDSLFVFVADLCSGEARGQR